MQLDTLATRRPVKETISRCPVCLAAITALVYEQDDHVIMAKVCPVHGRFETLLARDPSRYYTSLGSASGACCGGSSAGASCCAVESDEALRTTSSAGVDASPFDTLSTCLALIEIVDSCNLSCPACYAASPLGANDAIDCISFEDFERRVQGVIDRKGTIDILQLTGGEPTIHPEFERFLRWAVEHPAIGYTLINTNGVRLATDAAFRERLGAMRRERGRFELYLQFDGPQETGQRELRGADLREIRRRAIDECGALGVPTTLAMTVSATTLPHLGDTLRFGLARPHVRGITFQPIFTSGRVPERETLTISGQHVPVRTVGTALPSADDAASRGTAMPPTAANSTRETISVGDVIAAVVEQSEGVLLPDDFTPLPCGDPNCHTIGYLLRTDDGPVGMSRLLDLPALQGFLADRVNYSLSDLARCGCETEPLGELLKALEIGPERPFRLFVKPFMDAWTFDQDRIDRCCTHVIRRDGSLDSFCRYYLHGGAAGGA